MTRKIPEVCSQRRGNRPSDRLEGSDDLFLRPAEFHLGEDIATRREQTSEQRADTIRAVRTQAKATALTPREAVYARFSSRCARANSATHRAQLSRFESSMRVANVERCAEMGTHLIARTQKCSSISRHPSKHVYDGPHRS